ncbi:uncharacterized protein [Dermacentor albipictus]
MSAHVYGRNEAQSGLVYVTGDASDQLPHDLLDVWAPNLCMADVADVLELYSTGNLQRFDGSKEAQRSTGRAQYTRLSSNTTSGDVNTSMTFTSHLS